MLYVPMVIYIDETMRTVVAVCFPGLQRVPENFAKMTKRPIFHIPNSKRVRLTFVAIRNQQMRLPKTHEYGEGHIVPENVSSIAL